MGAYSRLGAYSNKYGTCNIFLFCKPHGFSFRWSFSRPPSSPSPNREKTHCIPVIETNAVIYVGTVMVKMLHASVTYPTMLCAQGSHQSTRVTEIFQRVLSSLHLPLFKKRNLGTKITLVNRTNGTQNKLVLTVRLNTKNLNKQHKSHSTRPPPQKGKMPFYGLSLFSNAADIFYPVSRGPFSKYLGWNKPW